MWAKIASYVLAPMDTMVYYYVYKPDGAIIQ